MIWSISAHKTFEHCPRQWFYKFVVADGKVKKVPERVEVTRLSRLKTVDAWRGEIVDRIISEIIVQKIRRKESLNKAELLNTAKSVFSRQWEIESGIDTSFKAQFGFIDIEFSRTIGEDKLHQAYSDIELALVNFLNDEELLSDLYNAQILIAQRSLTFNFSSFPLRGTPDLIAFYKDKSPKIFDWKVHTFGTHSNEEQLLFYAYSLLKCTPHKDFPEYLSRYQINDIRLAEIQLIANETGYKRNYEINNSKIEKLENLISLSLLKMYGSSEFKKFGEIDASDFDITRFEDNCINCAFKKQCNQAEL